MNKLFAETDWVDWRVNDKTLNAEAEDKLARTIKNMAKSMSIFSRAEFPTDFGLVVLTKFEFEFVFSESEEVEEKDHVFYTFKLKGQFSTPKVEGMIHFY